MCQHGGPGIFVKVNIITLATALPSPIITSMVRAERGVRGGARQAVPRPRAGDSRADEAGVSVLTVPPDPAPSFNPLPKRPVLN